MPPLEAPRPLPLAWWTAAAFAFCLIATLNAGGYRFGVADQAFYLPAIQRHLAPESFPRDRLIIDDQDRLTVFTAAIAAGVRTAGIPVEAVFAAIYVTTLVLLFGGAVAVGRALGLSELALLAFTAALTLKHRVGLTGVNTLESYGHPRMLAFSIGLWAVAAVLRGRTWLALASAAAALAIHPTTGLWIGVWVGVAALVADRRHRVALGSVAVAIAAAAAWAIPAGPFANQLIPMDAEWLGVLGMKDYLFPTRWPVAAWLTAALYVAAVAAPFAWRRRQGIAGGFETGMAAGLFSLLAIFLLTLPASHWRIALAVQFQVSRIFWMFDFVGTCYIVWLLADGWPGRPRSTRSLALRPVIVAAVLVLAAVARGSYVKWVEHPERPLARLSLPQDEWQGAMDWLRTRSPVGAHVLANPGHAWRYGSSVRVAAGRDVLLEEVKDTAMSMYSRRVAMHVLERIRAIGDYDRLAADEVRALAARYDLDYLVAERPFDLPVAYRNARFTVYELTPH